MSMISIHDQPKLAARGWRHPLVLLVLEFLFVGVPLFFAYGFAMNVVYRSSLGWGLLFALFAALVMSNAYVLWARFVARRDVAELALKKSSGLVFGATLGALLMCGVIAVIALAGDLRLSVGGKLALAGLPGVAALAGVAEELIARGVVLRNLENVFGSEIAIALSAALFGWLHLGNPHATALSAAAIGLEGGVMVAAIYIATRSLWWTMGVHAAWNFTQTGVFGLADSGQAGHGLLRSEIVGPEWFTGGMFGVEASVVSVAVCAIVAIFFLARAYRDKRIVVPIWERPRR